MGVSVVVTRYVNLCCNSEVLTYGGRSGIELQDQGDLS